MKLFYKPGACSLAVHIALREANLPFELVKVDLATKQLDDGSDFRAVNPKGYVPALALDDGHLLTEGPVICQYVADQVPGSELAPPAGTMARYRVHEWQNFVSTELHKGFSPLFNPAMPDEAKRLARERLALRLAVVNDALAGRDFLTGEAFTIADAYLYVVLTWAAPMGVDLSAFPNLQAFMTRAELRPAVRAARQAEHLKA